MGPKTGLKVCEPAPNSGVFVLPTVIAPAARSRSTMSASSSGTKSAKMGDPKVVRMPRVRVRSLWATGSPWSRPSGSPAATARSALSASASSVVSGRRVTMAFTRGFASSIRPRCAFITSTAERSRLAIRRASSVAGVEQR